RRSEESHGEASRVRDVHGYEVLAGMHRLGGAHVDHAVRRLLLLYRADYADVLAGGVRVLLLAQVPLMAGHGVVGLVDAGGLGALGAASHGREALKFAANLSECQVVSHSSSYRF